MRAREETVCSGSMWPQEEETADHVTSTVKKQAYTLKATRVVHYLTEPPPPKAFPSCLNSANIC